MKKRRRQNKAIRRILTALAILLALAFLLTPALGRCTLSGDGDASAAAVSDGEPNPQEVSYN